MELSSTTIFVNVWLFLSDQEVFFLFILYKGRLREREVQWALRSRGMSKRTSDRKLRAAVYLVNRSKLCYFLWVFQPNACLFRILLKGWDAEACMHSSTSLAALFTARHGPANYLIYTRCFRTGDSVTCSFTGWDCSLQWESKNSN